MNFGDQTGRFSFLRYLAGRGRDFRAQRQRDSEVAVKEFALGLLK